MLRIEISQQVKNVLKFLMIKKVIGRKHTEETHIIKKFKHLLPQQRKIAMRNWQRCIKEGLVLQKKSTGAIHISLNPRKIKEIKGLIDENEG